MIMSDTDIFRNELKKLPLILKTTVLEKVVKIVAFEWTAEFGVIPKLGYSLPKKETRQVRSHKKQISTARFTVL